MMILRTWIQDDSKVSASELKALEGVSSTMAMDDASVEECTDVFVTDGTGSQSMHNGDEDDVAGVINMLD
ncbi:unnamed protein product [Linum trigynum]|uniref:Uncharacterized protein n=1 Tax=Linum trigynum TaxID=586398 RepID=A0AAV2GJQ3_9ROSI